MTHPETTWWTRLRSHMHRLAAALGLAGEPAGTRRFDIRDADFYLNP